MARQLVIELVGKADKFTKSLGDADKASQSFGDKISSAGKKMTAFATVPIIGFLGAATKAGVEEAAQMDNLSKVLENTTNATTKQVDAVEKQIGAWQKASNFSDGEMRPAFEDLVTATKDVDQATKLMSIALDIASATGKPLTAVTEGLAKAQLGQVAGLSRLGIATKNAAGETMAFEDIMKSATEIYGGAAQRASETTAGKMKQMQMTMGDLTEDIGKAMIPVLSSLLNTIQPVVTWFSNLDEGQRKMIVVIGLAIAAIGPLIGIITALGGAIAFVAANPIVLIIAAVAALAAGLVFAYQKSETFRSIVDSVWNAIKMGVTSMWRVVEPILNAFKGVLDRLVGPLGTVAGLAGKVGGAVGGLIGKIPGFANGGVVGGPIGQAQLAMVHGGERISPYRGGQNGGGGTTVVNINVGGSVIQERDLGRTIADAIRDNGLYGVS